MRLIFTIMALALASWAQNLTAIPTVEAVVPDTMNLADSIDTDSLDLLTADREGPDTVEYSAIDLQYDFPTQTFNLNDKALIKYRGATLSGDTIWFDQGNQVLQASGDPVLKDPKNPPLAGYRMKYNMKSRIGQVFYGSSFRDNQRFNGMDIRRLPDSRLQLSRGDFSTCNDSTHQHYFFYSRRMVVTPKENIVAAPVVLNLGGVPVAVLPLLVSPLKSGKRSGLLAPKFGGDQQQGFYLTNLGFYWAISDYMDATLAGDVIEGSQARFEKSSTNASFNYKKLYVLDGNITARAYLEEFNFGNSGWDVNFRHKQNLRPDEKSVLSGSGSFVSSNDLRKNNSLNDSVVLAQQANANMTWLRTFSNGRTLSVRFQQDHNLNTDSVVREMPDVNFNSSGPLLPFLESDGSGTPGFFERFNYSLQNHANYLTTKFPDTLSNRDSSRNWLGNTLNLKLDWTGQLFKVLNVTPSYSYTGDWSAYSYLTPFDSLNRRPTWNSDVLQGQAGDYIGRQSMSIAMDTKLFGIWRPEWGRFFGIRHTITPGVSYTFAPEVDTNYTMVPHPRMSQANFQSKSKTVGFSLGNAFDLKYLTARDSGRGDGSANLRLLNVSTSTGYNFAADSLQWSLISSAFGIQVIPEYIFSINTQHNVYHRFSSEPNRQQVPELTFWNYGLNKSFNWTGMFNAGILGDSADAPDMLKWSISGDYGFSFSSTRVGENLFRDDIGHSANLSASLAPTPKWTMQYQTRYDFTRGEFASHQFTFKRDLHCWDMTFTWTPLGTLPGWSFVILVRELPDIKLQAGSTSAK